MWWRIVLANFYLQVICCGIAALSGQDGSGVDNFGFAVARQPHQLVQHNFLVGIASLGASRENHTQCGRELEMLLQAIAKREVWGLKVVDYFGAPPTTFTWGNYFWFSTPDLCDDLNQPFTINLARTQTQIFNATSPVAMQFVVVYLNFTTPFFIDLRLPFETYIHLGLCLPQSCESNRIRHFTNAYFQNQNFETQRNFQLQMEAVEVKAPHFSWRYFQQTGCVIFLIILFVCICLPLVAETVHKSRHNLQIQHTMYIKNHHDANPPPAAPPPPPPPAQQATNNGDLSFHPLKSSIWEKLLMCFRLADNYAAVISLENSNRNSIFLTMMAGMRTIICLWITVFHVYYYSLFAMSNTPFIFAKLEKLALQPVMQACFYVDVFFVMSSFLLVYNFLSNTKQLQRIASGTLLSNAKMFMRSLLQRYMRLTPVMIVTMLLSTMVSDFLNMYSPFRLGEHSGLYCKTNWWYNLLYIHNFLDMNSICCSWTWYLACEMQYFVLFTGLLYVHVKHPKSAKIAFVALALGFVVVAWIINYANGITFQIDVIYSTLNQLYVKPWVRITPYLGGAAMGWCMHTFHPRQQQQQQQQQQEPQQQQHLNPQTARIHFRLRGRTSKIFWLLSFVLYVATNFMSYWRSTPTWAVATIMSVGKLLFALWVGGVIVICARGRGGRLNSLLSARVFLFLNKFCFSVYMLAPIIVVAMFGLRNEPTNFTEVGSGADFFAVIILAIISAFLLHLLLELPMQKMSKVLLD